MGRRIAVFAKVLDDRERHLFDHIAWHPWFYVNEHERPQFPMMVLRKWIRERGGVSPDEAAFSVTVYVYDQDTPTHDNGRPKFTIATTFTVEPQERTPANVS